MKILKFLRSKKNKIKIFKRSSCRALKIYEENNQVILIYKNSSIFKQTKKAISNDGFNFFLSENRNVTTFQHGKEIQLAENELHFTEKKYLFHLTYLFPKIFLTISDLNNPNNSLSNFHNSVWQVTQEWKKEETEFVKIVNFKGKIIAYFNIKNKGIFAVLCCLVNDIKNIKTKLKNNKLNKHEKNPIIKPEEQNEWESEAVFNPAVLYENNEVHIVYRAMGKSSTSVLGYAKSKDGINISWRSSKPIYSPREEFECPYGKNPTLFSNLYISGGGYGGCEDPRLVRIGDTIYLTYVAYDGMNPPRVALSSISLDNFLNQRWLWEKPVLISPPGVVDKNCCLLPEKINGKFVIFHRIYPNILIDFVDDLNFDGTKWLKGEHLIEPRKDMWDSRKIGIGAPPIKTEDGWLLIYQAVGEQDPAKYKIGAMLLDLKNPTKVLYRSFDPILEPEEKYENEGFKFGVVYPCGAVIIKDRLFVYYGGADKFVCAASTNLQNFLNNLKCLKNQVAANSKVKQIF